MIININSHNDMIKFGTLLASQLKESMVILLNGDLGAGKTTLTKGIAKGLEIEEIITSPTFTIAKIYTNGRMVLNHIDAYRLEGLSEDFGLEDYMVENSITVIEWSEFLPDMFSNYIDIKICYTNEGRQLELKAYGKKENNILEVLSDEVGD